MPAAKAHKKCRSYDVCQDLRKLLKKSKVSRAEISFNCEKTDPWPCHHMYSNARLLYNSISPENSAASLDFLATLFTSPDKLIGQRFTQEANEAPFHCPDLDIDIYQPCEVKSCSFHTKNPWTLNCILFYRLRQGREVLSLNELAFLLDRDVGSLRTALNKTVRHLSSAALKETIAREAPDERSPIVLKDGLCVSCHRPVEDAPKPTTKSGYSYCSKFCVDSKPPAAVRLEQELELPIRRILSLCIDRFSSVRNMCNALGIGPTVFISWCRKNEVPIPDSKLR
jgi:hypothetical protein